jgi:hypothetical protein
VSEQAASGIPVSAFCARKGLSAASFYQWRSRLGGGSAVSGVSSEAFVDLGALGGGGRFELRLDFGHGVTLALKRG